MSKESKVPMTLVMQAALPGVLSRRPLESTGESFKRFKQKIRSDLHFKKVTKCSFFTEQVKSQGISQ